MADASLDGIVVLVVDDHPDSLRLVEHILIIHGATVITAESAIEALRLVGASRPDVLLSDIGLPQMDGYELLKKIRALERDKRDTQNQDVHIPAAAVSAFTSTEDRRRSILAGFRFHLGKPIDIAELVATVASLAGRIKPESGQART